MPADHRLRLDDFQRVQHLRSQTIQPGKHQPINVAESHSLRRSAPQHIELVPKNKDFGLQRGPRPEQSMCGGLFQAQQQLGGEETCRLYPNAAREDCFREFGSRSAYGSAAAEQNELD